MIGKYTVFGSSGDILERYDISIMKKIILIISTRCESCGGVKYCIL